MIDFLII